MSRTTSTVRTTTVRVVAKPMGEGRENPPHLADLRRFVDECDGLPDDTVVNIVDGHLNESGRHDTILTAVIREPIEAP
jgi:hypothetical protein